MINPSPIRTRPKRPTTRSASAVIAEPERVRAVAFRMEGVHGRWRVTNPAVRDITVTASTFQSNTAVAAGGARYTTTIRADLTRLEAELAAQQYDIVGISSIIVNVGITHCVIRQ